MSISPINESLAQAFLVPCLSAVDLKNWIYTYLDLDLPIGHVDPDSNSSPMEALYEAYAAYRDDKCFEIPGFIWVSSRDSCKTLSGSILNVLLMVHFKAQIGHLAATKGQAGRCITYVNRMITTIKPYLEYHHRQVTAASKTHIGITNEDATESFVEVIVANLAGGNSFHGPVATYDELDCLSKQGMIGYEESKMMATRYKNRGPLRLKYSTRKFAFGIFEKEIQNALQSKERVLRWNIIDMTERCDESIHRPDLPKSIRYITGTLPLMNLSFDELSNLSIKEQGQYQPIEAFHGCTTCPLLSVCQMRLAHRDKSAKGILYKPVWLTRQYFNEIEIDMAEAQLMCFSAKAQILMSDGATKDIAQVQVGDEVISHTGLTRKVMRLFQRHHTGPVLKVQHTNWKHFDDLLVTPEHPYLVNGSDFVSISDATSWRFGKHGRLAIQGDYLSLPIEYQVDERRYISYDEFVSCPVVSTEGRIRTKTAIGGGRLIPSTYELTEEFGWIVGFFLAEGFFSRRQYSDYKRLMSITFCSHILETDYHDKIRRFAQLVGLTTSELKSKKNLGFTQDIYNNTLAELFFAMCGEYSGGKRLHHVLMNANKSFLSGVLSGFDDGDGTKRVKPYKELTTTSYTLATQLFLIAARLGLCPRITKKPKIQDRKQVYLIHYINKEYTVVQSRTKFSALDNFNLYRLDEGNIKKEFYSGCVYNLEVEHDNSYIVNGAAVHNCWRPSLSGLVYGRFDTSEETGNIYTLSRAYEVFTGDKAPKDLTLQMLVDLMILRGVQFKAAVDFGTTHCFAITVHALIANGEWWLVDTYAVPGMEFEDMIALAEEVRDKYRMAKWYPDNSAPMFIKAFRKRRMPCVDFKKDVLGGIEAVRGQIINAKGLRRLKVLRHERNEFMIKGFQMHHFKIDAQGNPTKEPDDEEYADVADTVRYFAQNHFGVKGKVISPSMPKPDDTAKGISPDQQIIYNSFLDQKLRELAQEGVGTTGKSPTGGIFWDFSGSDTEE